MNLSLVTLVYADPKHVEKPAKQHHSRGGGAHQQPRTSSKLIDKLYPKRNRMLH